MVSSNVKVLDRGKCHFMVLGDPNYTCNLQFSGTIMKGGKKEKVLSVSIADRLIFIRHLGSMIKRVNQKFHALSKLKRYMGFEKIELIM